MDYIRLGNSDLIVSRICLGCMGFGEAKQGIHSWTLDEEKSTEIIKKALESGINFLIQLLHMEMEQVNNILDVL